MVRTNLIISGINWCFREALLHGSKFRRLAFRAVFDHPQARRHLTTATSHSPLSETLKSALRSAFFSSVTLILVLL
jgi:hypothetical protein